jgi:hypothetical protein
MAARVCKGMLSVFGLFAALGVSAKPPELPTSPDTEFKVLSEYAQEHFQAEGPRRDGLFLPDPCENPVNDLAMSGGCSSLVPSNAHQGIHVVVSVKPGIADLSFDAFEVAEAHRAANELDEARRWYAGIIRYWPRSQWAKLAAQRLDRLEKFRVVATAGEEQSEEPPLARPSEQLQVMPRPVMPQLK